MYETLKETIFLTVPLVASLILSFILTYLYYKDRNKRKLVFAIAVLITAFGFYNRVLGLFDRTPIFLHDDWLFMPMALAVLIAAVSSLVNVKDFKIPFLIFMAGTLVSLVAFFTQLSFTTLRLVITGTFMTVSVPILIYLFLKSRDSKDLNFLLATLCFLFQGMVMDLGESRDIPVMLSVFGVVFFLLMFNQPKTENTSTMASFVVLERKLNEAKQNLKCMEEKLLRAQRLATIGELAGLIGHDLRNPLQGIAGAAYYLKTHSKISDGVCNEMLDNIDACIEYSNKIVNDLIEYSQVIHLQLSKTDPKSLIVRSLRQIEVPAHIEVVNEATSELLFELDSSRIERVFVSIIKNAFDAMPDGGKLTISSKKTHDSVIFTFQDTGMGMNKETLDKIWSPLFTTKAKGMGFGLAICKRIVEAHGGTVEANSRLGTGSVFTLSFPLEIKQIVEPTQALFEPF